MLVNKPYILSELLKAKIQLSKLEERYSQVEYDYQQHEAVLKLMIWSDKGWLKRCSFSGLLSDSEKPDLSNDTLRNAALTLAKKHDHILSIAYNDLTRFRSEIAKFRSIVDRFETILQIFDATGGDTLEIID